MSFVLVCALRYATLHVPVAPLLGCPLVDSAPVRAAVAHSHGRAFLDRNFNPRLSAAGKSIFDR